MATKEKQRDIIIFNGEPLLVYFENAEDQTKLIGIENVQISTPNPSGIVVIPDLETIKNKFHQKGATELKFKDGTTVDTQTSAGYSKKELQGVGTIIGTKAVSTNELIQNYIDPKIGFYSASNNTTDSNIKFSTNYSTQLIRTNQQINPFLNLNSAINVVGIANADTASLEQNNNGKVLALKMPNTDVVKWEFVDLPPIKKVINSLIQDDVFKAAPKVNDEAQIIIPDPKDGSDDIYNITNLYVNKAGNQASYVAFKKHFTDKQHTIELFWFEASSGTKDKIDEYGIVKLNPNSLITLKNLIENGYTFDIVEDQDGVRKVSLQNKAKNRFITFLIEDGEEASIEIFDGNKKTSFGVFKDPFSQQPVEGLMMDDGSLITLPRIKQAILDSNLAKTIAEENERKITGMQTMITKHEAALKWIIPDMNLINDFVKLSSTAPGGVPIKAYLQAGDITISQDPKKANGIATKHYVDSLINHDTGKLKRVSDFMLLDETKSIKVKKISTVAGVETFEDTTVPYTSTSDMSKATHIIFKVMIKYFSNAGLMYAEPFFPNYKKIGSDWNCSNGQVLDIQAYNNGVVVSNAEIDFGNANINFGNKQAFLNFGQTTKLPKGTDGGEWFATITELFIVEEAVSGGGSGGGTEINNATLVPKAGADTAVFSSLKQFLTPTVNMGAADPNATINKEMLSTVITPWKDEIDKLNDKITKLEKAITFKTIDQTKYNWGSKDLKKQIAITTVSGGVYNGFLATEDKKAGYSVSGSHIKSGRNFYLDDPYATKLRFFNYVDGTELASENIAKFEIKG